MAESLWWWECWGCIIVIVSFLSLSLSLSSSSLTTLSLPNIAFTLISGKPAISAASGHSNARQKQVVVSERETRNESGPKSPQAAASPSPKGQRSPRSHG